MENKKEYTHLSFNIDTQLKSDFQIQCIKNNAKMTDVLENFMKEYVNKK